MGKSLLILGAGGHARVVAETAEAMKNADGQKIYERIDFLDDHSEHAVGGLEDLEVKGQEYDEVFCGIGDNGLRKQLLEQSEAFKLTVPALVHPTAYISPSAVVGKGTIVEPGAVINANAVIGVGCIVSIGAVIDHDVTIEEYAHVNTAAICKARSRVRAGAKIDAGMVVEES